MADFEEVFSDAGEDVKKFFKKNPFILLCIGVGAVALLMWYLRERNGTTASEETAPYVLSYGGYPSGGDSYASTDDEYWQTVVDTMKDEMLGMEEEWQSKYDELKDQSKTDLDNLNSSWQDKYDSLLDKLDTPSTGTTVGGGTDGGGANQYYGVQSTVKPQSSAVDVQSVLDQMKYNSNMALITEGNDAYLHNQNVKLAESIGAAWDERTKTWWYGGQLAYAYNTEYESNPAGYVDKDLSSNLVMYDSNTDYMAKIGEAIRNEEGGALINSLNALRNEKIADSGRTPEQLNVHYDKNTDYSALIAQAKAQGADASVIETLTQQREAKIRGEKMTHRYNELRS